MKLKNGDIVFHNWIIKDVIGKGSFGTVYVIEREEFGRTYRAAAKVISIPGDRNDIHEAEEGITKNNIKDYYRSLMEEIVRECDLMERMKGDSHIVSYEDHYVESGKDGKGFTIYIRMELLTPFVSLMQDESKRMGEQEALKLGIDLCKGLLTCQKFQVVHRDIKTENIFVSETGNYKLGDFGISKMMQGSEMAFTKKGSQLYMAPEIFRGEKYDATVDIYSLGIVLYRLMNHNRIPFLPPYPEMIYYQDKKKALYRRLSGEKFPAPCDSGPEFAAVILKAASYLRKDRYRNPEEMKAALEDIQKRYEHPDIQRNPALKKTILKTAILSSLLFTAACTAAFGIVNYKKMHDTQAKHVMVMISAVSSVTYDGFSEWSEAGIKVMKRIIEERYMIVPDVVGYGEEEAVEFLEHTGYEQSNIYIKYMYNNEIAAGKVILQSTQSGQKVLKSDYITITVSLGIRPKSSSGGNDDSEWIWKAL